MIEVGWRNECADPEMFIQSAEINAQPFSSYVQFFRYFSGSVVCIFFHLASCLPTYTWSMPPGTAGCVLIYL